MHVRANGRTDKQINLSVEVASANKKKKTCQKKSDANFAKKNYITCIQIAYISNNVNSNFISQFFALHANETMKGGIRGEKGNGSDLNEAAVERVGGAG